MIDSKYVECRYKNLAFEPFFVFFMLSCLSSEWYIDFIYARHMNMNDLYILIYLKCGVSRYTSFSSVCLSNF